MYIPRKSRGTMFRMIFKCSLSIKTLNWRCFSPVSSITSECRSADVRAWTLGGKLKQFWNNDENKRKSSKCYQLGLSRGTRERALFKLFNTDVSKLIRLIIFLNMYRKESNARMCRPFFLHKVRLDKSIIRDSILNGYKTICLGVAFSEIFGSPELRKREHENKTSFLFPSPPLFAYLLLSRLPHYLRAWNRLQLAWVYIILNVHQI